MTELVRKHYRRQVPEAHRGSLDTRLRWLWNQRFGTIQTIWNESPDMLDRTACTHILQAILASDLGSIELLFRRLEGGPQGDEEVLEKTATRI